MRAKIEDNEDQEKRICSRAELGLLRCHTTLALIIGGTQSFTEIMGQSPEVRNLGKETPRIRQQVHIRNGQHSQCFLYLLLNTHTRTHTRSHARTRLLSPGNSDLLTGHQAISRPARKKSSTVPRLVFSIAWPERKTCDSQTTENAPKMFQVLWPWCWWKWPFPALLKKHFPGNCDITSIFKGLRNHSSIEA